ncbi:MAG: exodeoxyribonuclease VII small subunit [Clostridia bacterium]|nr:exodeoxyribonuclease VII small subunit [Clostridia bacterium]
MDFETKMKELEEIIRKLESGQAGLAESMELYEKGVRLSAECSALLEQARQKIVKLVEDNGQKAELPFSPNPES